MFGVYLSQNRLSHLSKKRFADLIHFERNDLQSLLANLPKLHKHRI